MSKKREGVAVYHPGENKLFALIREGISYKSLKDEYNHLLQSKKTCERQKFVISRKLKNPKNKLSSEENQKLIDRASELEHTLTNTKKTLSQYEGYLKLYNAENINEGRACDGFTPVFLAIQLRRPDSLKLLLEKGGDLYAKNKNGVTAEKYAKNMYNKLPVFYSGVQKVIDDFLLFQKGVEELPGNPYEENNNSQTNIQIPEENKTAPFDEEEEELFELWKNKDKKSKESGFIFPDYNGKDMLADIFQNNSDQKYIIGENGSQNIALENQDF